MHKQDILSIVSIHLIIWVLLNVFADGLTTNFIFSLAMVFFVSAAFYAREDVHIQLQQTYSKLIAWGAEPFKEKPMPYFNQKRFILIYIFVFSLMNLFLVLVLLKVEPSMYDSRVTPPVWFVVFSYHFSLFIESSFCLRHARDKLKQSESTYCGKTII